jgi:2-phosphoglycerate kinase
VTYWIGGGSGAGKSTVARRLAARHGLTVYSTDDAMSDHTARTAPADRPSLTAFIAMDRDERWVDRTPAEMLDTFHWFRGEAFDLIPTDVAGIGGGVVAEGFRLLPHLVKPLLTPADRAVWLLPTPEFRRAAFDCRGSTWTIAARTRDPERALRNLLERDRLFTERLRAEARRLNLPAIEVTTATTEPDLVDRVAAALDLTR